MTKLGGIAPSPAGTRLDPRSEERFSTVFRASPVAMSVSTLAEGRFVEVNDSFLQMTGYQPGEVITRTAYELSFWYDPDARAHLLALIDRHGGSVRCVELPLRIKSGDMVFVDVSVEVIRLDDQPCLLIVYQDVTLRRQAEQALRQSEQIRGQAEELMDAGPLTARVAHEINNPLAGIKSAFSVIKGAVPLDHPSRQFIGPIEREIDRIARIVRRLLARDEARPNTLGNVGVGQIINDVVALATPISLARSVRIEVHAVGGPVVGAVDEDSLRQVFYNLVLNAVEASRPGGVVTITAAATEEELSITVSDEGAGIEEHLRDRIFEPFFTTKRGADLGGVGLGLSICKGIVESLKGHLDCQSEPGKGARFKIVIPRRTSAT